MEGGSLAVEAAVTAIRARLRGILVGGMGVIATLHMAITWQPEGTFPKLLVDMVHVDREQNIPTWFSSAQLVLLALVFFALAFHETHTRRRRLATAFWCTSGGLALFLSMDETAMIHEGVGALAGYVFKDAEPGSFAATLSSFPSYYWALIYVPLAVPCGVAFGWFALREMVGSRLLAISGLVLFGLGAVVLDHLEGRLGTPEHGRLLMELAGEEVRFDIFLVEELLEMLGVFLLIEAALRHLLRVVGAFADRVSPTG